MDEGIRKAGLGSRKGPAVAPPVRRCCRDGKMGMTDPTKSLERSSAVGRRLHGPNGHKAVLVEAAGRGHSPDNPLRGPHFPLRSARDAEALWVERDGVHGPAWYAGGVEAAVRSRDEALQRPNDCDSTFGVAMPSPRGRSRRDRGPNSRCLPASPGIPDCRRQKMAIPARPTNLPRLLARIARNREARSRDRS